MNAVQAMIRMRFGLLVLFLVLLFRLKAHFQKQHRTNMVACPARRKPRKNRYQKNGKTKGPAVPIIHGLDVKRTGQMPARVQS